MRFEIFDKTKKEKILHILDNDYGIKKLPHLFLKSGEDKIRIFSGSLAKEEINLLAANLNIEIIGSKLCTLVKEHSRLNFDIMNLPSIKHQIKKSIFELDDNEVKLWMQGEDIRIMIPKEIEESKFIGVSHGNDFFGVARNHGFLKNYVPKERRVKK